jgi:prepilin-type N-terminal cleavage/methylation domain-containing protein
VAAVKPENDNETRMFIKRSSLQQRQHGFTLIEITAVLVLMAIIAAYVIGRSVTTDQVDIVGQTDRLRNQIRFAQASAMKQSSHIWGIKSDSATNQYWLFAIELDREDPEEEPDIEPGEEDLAANRRVFPGENNDIIAFADLELDDITPSFTLFFDRIGKPYNTYISQNSAANDPRVNDLRITVSAGGQTRDITVTPETGMVQ